MLDRSALYEVVERYASFGNHHTGTGVDQATTSWLGEQLRRLGAQVQLETYEFDRCVTSAELRVGQVLVPCVPLFYSGFGEVVTNDLTVVQVPASVVGNAHGLNPVVNVPDHTSAVVIAIDGPDDLPVQCNRVPHEPLGQPAVVIPGNWADRVSVDATLRFQAHLEPASSANTIAEFGDPSSPSVVITTPLTGWTPAAGERGTGLAVALHVATALARTNHVVFSACTGHEIDHLGLRHHLASRDFARQRVIHFGASVAATETSTHGVSELGPRLTLTTASGPVRSKIATRVPDANWALLDIERPWPGEGGTWLEAGAHVLSFLGGSSLFHTEHDLPEYATTPEAIELAAHVALDAVRLFLDDTPETA